MLIQQTDKRCGIGARTVVEGYADVTATAGVTSAIIAAAGIATVVTTITATVGAAATVATEAVVGVAKSNHAAAMHGFGVGSATTFTVAISRGVVVHIFCLTGFTVDLDIVQNYIATTAVVSKLNLNIA